MHSQPLGLGVLFLGCKHLLLYWHIIIVYSTDFHKDILIQVPREITLMSGSVQVEMSTLRGWDSIKAASGISVHACTHVRTPL